MTSDVTTEPETGPIPGDDRFVEVYAPLRLPGQAPLAFEIYRSYDRVERTANNLVLRIVPLAVGALLLLQLTQNPITVSLARRVAGHEAERAALFERAQSASDGSAARSRQTCTTAWSRIWREPDTRSPRWPGGSTGRRPPAWSTWARSCATRRDRDPSGTSRQAGRGPPGAAPADRRIAGQGGSLTIKERLEGGTVALVSLPVDGSVDPAPPPAGPTRTDEARAPAVNGTADAGAPPTRGRPTLTCGAGEVRRREPTPAVIGRYAVAAPGPSPTPASCGGCCA